MADRLDSQSAAATALWILPTKPYERLADALLEWEFFKRGEWSGFEARPKSLRKLRESIKPRTRRNNGRSLEAIVTDLNRTLPGWIGYFEKLGLFYLSDAREAEIASLRNGVNH